MRPTILYARGGKRGKRETAKQEKGSGKTGSGWPYSEDHALKYGTGPWDAACLDNYKGDVLLYAGAMLNASSQGSMHPNTAIGNRQ